MSSKTATWIIAAGALMMFIGLCFLPGAFGGHPDTGHVGDRRLPVLVGRSDRGRGHLRQSSRAAIRNRLGRTAKGFRHREPTGSRAVATFAEPRLRWFNAKFTSFISAELVWLNITMFAPAPTSLPPAPASNKGGRKLAANARGA